MFSACTNHFPVLLGASKLAQRKSHNYFVLQSLHKARLYTTLYHEAYTKDVPVLLCATKPAESTFQDYFVLQRLHKALEIAAPKPDGSRHQNKKMRLRTHFLNGISAG